ncbi:M48 family metalloprotease [Litorimonas sp. RW-G-Af-16]
MPALSLEKLAQEDIAMTELNERSKTLLNIGYPVLRDNAALCPKTRLGIGAATHSQEDYDKRLRVASLRILGAGPRERIFQIVEGGPADQAGLEIGDELLAADNAPLAPDSDVFQDMLKAGQATPIRVRREDFIITKTVTANRVCDYDLKLSSSAAINAYANGRAITITTGMMNFVESPDELALIIGHELAHNTMGHIRKIIGNFILSGMATRYTRPFESEADYVGLYYQVRAGYSPDNVEDFWRRLAKINPKSVNRAKTHPTFPDRYLRLAAARAEIEAKQAAGEILVPNFKTDADTVLPSGKK